MKEAIFDLVGATILSVNMDEYNCAQVEYWKFGWEYRRKMTIEGNGYSGVVTDIIPLEHELAGG